MLTKIFFAVSALVLANQASAKDGVRFTNLKDGQTIHSGFVAKFAVTGKKLKPAAESKPEDTSTGHHHLIIDAGPMAAGEIIPADATRIHFGKGQGEAPLNLTPGDHTVTLQLGNAVHASYGPEWAETVHIHVK